MLAISISQLSANWIVTNDTESSLMECGSSTRSAITVDFLLDGYEIEELESNGDTWHRISNPQAGELLETGKPDLPVFSRLIAVPEGSDIKINISDVKEKIVSDLRIHPQGELVLESEGGGEIFTIDGEFYSSDTEYPGNFAETGEIAVMRDYSVTNLTIQPFQYNPAKRELRVITSMHLELEITGGGRIQQTEKISRAFDNIYASSILNYEQIRTRDDYQVPCYLFIYPNNTTVQNYLEYLLDWKTEKGFEVHSASTSITGTSTTSIKNYIQTAYDTWENPPEYICLVGDHGGSYDIPTWFENWSWYGGEGDQPYSQLDGTDVLADAIVGRLPYNNTSELQTLISKIINYETNPYVNSDIWLRRALLVGDPSSSEQSTIVTCKAVKEMIQQYDTSFTYNEIYSGDFDGLMNQGLNAGVSYMCYRGYIGMSGWDTNDISSLTNGFMLPFATILTCGTGGFSGYNCRSEYFAKAGTATNPKGAIGAIGTATSGTHTCFNNSVTLGIYAGIFQEDIFTMGGALVRGKLNLYMCYPQNPSNAVNIFSHWNNLMGDPGLQLYTGVPDELVVNYEEEVNAGLSYLEVNVTLPSSQSVKNAWVSLVQNGNQVSGFTDSSGNVFVPLENLDTGEVTVTVTAHDCIPYQGILDITTGTDLVTLTQVNIDDDSSGNSQGNNDGICNAGETIELWIDLENFGSQLQNNVSMILRSTSSFVTITNSTVNYGTISGGQTVTAPEAYVISIATETPGGIDLMFSLDISSSSSSWVDALEIPVSGPMLDFDHYTIVGGNNILDPGETAEMYVTMNNLGDLAATGITATLSCEDDRLTITDDYGSFSNISAGQSGNNYSNRYEVIAESQILPGTQIPVTLDIITENYMTDFTFLLEIGTVTQGDPLGADAYGYYIYDDEDDQYSLVPTYSWMEIDPSYGGSGTDTGIYSPEDAGESVVIDLPFVMQFYGVYYNQITICSNGWAAPGASENEGFMNWRLPGPGGPSPMIAAFWDDLRCTSGNVCYYNDYSNHRFIIEWSRLQNEYNNAEETFQIIIRNQLYYPTPTGDSEILIMYNEVNNVNSGNYRANHGQYCTTGIEDHTGTVGLEYTYNNTYPNAAKTLEDEMALLITTNSPAVLEPPVAELNADEFQFLLQQDEISYQNLTLANNGEASLVFSIAKDYLSSRASGGPDNYGYMWLDSDEAGGPEFDWLDISGYGTQVTFDHNDEGTDLIDIGFTFNYYGTDYTQFRINPNGWIGFGDDNDAWTNSIVPNTSAPRPALFPFWDDHYPAIGGNGGGNVYYHTDGDQLIIMFDQVIHYPGQYNGTYDFEVIIDSDGGIKFQYNELEGDIDSSTIGIQNETGDDGLCMVYNSTYIEEFMAIEFYKVIDWLDVSQTNGIVGSGASLDVTLTANAEDLDNGNYDCILHLLTNDPNLSSLEIPVTMQVGNAGVTYGDVDGNEFVESYDASISLQYFVGMDPIPEIDPIPWEPIRIAAADVDGNGSVESYDASLILQYVVGIITEFPAENLRSSKGLTKSKITSAYSEKIVNENKSQNVLYKK